MHEIKLVITRDGEETKEYEPSVIHKVIDNFIRGIKMEIRMFVLDMRYKTNYRKIRRQLLREKRKQAYAASIGLVPN